MSKRGKIQPRDELGRFAKGSRTGSKRSKPEVRKPRPETKRLKPEARRPGPETKRPKPEARRPGPEAKRPKPEARRSRLEAKRPRPEAKRQKPEVRKPRLEARRPRPEARKPVKIAVRLPKRPEVRRDAYGRFVPKRRRDEQGRFAVEVYGRVKKPRRDERGRFAPPPVRKKLPVPKPRRRRRPERPLVAERSRRAEVLVQERLLELQSLLALLEAGLAMDVQSFVNKDGTVDGELRVGNLPDEWRSSAGVNLLAATLSAAIRDWSHLDARPAMGGAFWVSFGVRFGPRSQAEAIAMEEFYRRYKRHRGLPQVGTYPTPAWSTGALQLALVGDATGMRAMIRHFVDKRGLAPATILVRVIWTPDGSRPGHYRGEK